jgi:hypothetical protein
MAAGYVPHKTLYLLSSSVDPPTENMFIFSVIHVV